jgi:hypothetical protein
MEPTLKHRETHPNLDVDGCFACRVAGVQFGAASMPTRKGTARSAVIESKDKVLHKDLDAYKRLRQEGLQPKRIDGSAELERRAEEPWQVETGILPNKSNIV